MKATKFKSIQKALIRPAYSRADLLSLLGVFSDDNISVDSIIDELCTKNTLKEFYLGFPNRTYTVYASPTTSLEVILMAIHPLIHLSHASAMAFHGLSHKPTSPIYVNIEQKAGSPANANLTQGGIDSAFKSAPRVSNNITRLNREEICLLAGKNTGYLGVENFNHGEDTIRVTSIERTLIDIVNRPAYAGGVEAILYAFQKAQGRVSITKLAQTLNAVGHVYPFHQCIGFFLEQAGNYSNKDLAPFRKLKKDFDFYLTNQINEPVLSSEWRLYVPKSMLK